MKSLQWLQKVGCLKNRAANLCSRTSTTSFRRRAPRRSCLADSPGPSWSSPSAVPCPEFDRRRPESPPPPPAFIVRYKVDTVGADRTRPRSDTTHRYSQLQMMRSTTLAALRLRCSSHAIRAAQRRLHRVYRE